MSRHMGRKPDLEKFPHKEKASKLLELVSAGCSMRHALELAGISESAAYNWLKLGEDPKAKKCYRDFAEQVKSAKAEFVLHHLNGIRRHAATSWQAHAWTLERCMPDQFATPSLLVRIKALEEHQDELRRLLKANGHNPEEFLDFSPGDGDGNKVEGPGEK